MPLRKSQYELIANVLKGTKPVEPVDDPLYKTGGGTYIDYTHDMKLWENTCLAFINHFRHDNPRFDGDRFLKACRK